MRSIISTVSPECLGDRLASLAVAAPASAAWPAVLDAIFVPLSLVEPFEIHAAFVSNGGVVAGSWDIGVYDSFLSRVFSTGSIIQGGVSVVQIENVSPFLLKPGEYYLAMAMTLNTGQVLRTLVATLAAGQVIGLGRFSTAMPLPVRPTLGPFTTTFMPHFGLLSSRRLW